MKKRILFEEIKKQINHKNVIVVVGSRQVGKTTLMKQLFKEADSSAKLWFDFDNPLEQKIFEDEEYNNIYERLSKMAKIYNVPEFLFFPKKLLINKKRFQTIGRGNLRKDQIGI